MLNMDYQPIIGLEVHVELKTKSKMFCRCAANYFRHEPNTHVCPVCLGLPGALPVPNRTAIEWCVMIGLALNCEITELSKFDRKNYFYPDLPKGYQISQYDEPFCINGYVLHNNKKKRIRIRRVHMEEDTAKLLHAVVNGEKVSLIDFNRCGVPLVEIVTEPDFSSASGVIEYLKKLQQIVRYLDVSDADMEKGQMRLEPNVSLRSTNKYQYPSYKVEIKNINSFRFVEKAINYEIERQQKLLNKGGAPVQETRGWDERKQETVSQRTKEEAHDYRYFPEPDIPPFRFTKVFISTLREQIPELPDAKLNRFKKAFALTDYDAEILTRQPSMADYFEEAIKVGKRHGVNPKQIANAIINSKINESEVLPAEIVRKILEAKETVVIEKKELEKAIKQVLLDNKKALRDYRGGKKKALEFIVGQVLKKLAKRVDVSLVRDYVLENVR